MEREIEAPPLYGDLLEHALEFAGNADVTGPRDFAVQRLCQRLDIFFSLRVQIGDREIGAFGVEMPGAAVCEAAVVGHADDQPLLALQHRRVPARTVGSV